MTICARDTMERHTTVQSPSSYLVGSKCIKTVDATRGMNSSLPTL